MVPEAAFTRTTKTLSADTLKSCAPSPDTILAAESVVVASTTPEAVARGTVAVYCNTVASNAGLRVASLSTRDCRDASLLAPATGFVISIKYLRKVGQQEWKGANKTKKYDTKTLEDTGQRGHREIGPTA